MELKGEQAKNTTLWRERKRPLDGAATEPAALAVYSTNVDLRLRLA